MPLQECTDIGLFAEVEPVKVINGRAIDGNRHELPIDPCENPMLVRTPAREAAEIFHDVMTTGMKDVGSVFMVPKSLLVERIVRIAGDVRTLVDDKYGSTHLTCEPFGQRTARETCSHNEIIVQR